MAARIVFMGSPEFSLPILEGLVKEYDLVGVVTQPDRPSGRGRTITAPPVKEMALRHDIPVIQPIKLKDPAAFETLMQWQPDLIVVAAYGQILRQNVLDLPPYGCINVHASLLPRWRGASPIQFAILEGDPESGVSIMKMDPGLDTGPVFSQARTPINATDNTETLSSRLAEIGAKLLLQTLPPYLAGDLQPVPQEDSRATYARLLIKEDGQLDFNRSAGYLERQVRAFNPWPGAYTIWKGEALKIIRAHAVESTQTEPGRRTIISKHPAIGTPHGVLVLDEVQPAGKKPMVGRVFINGAQDWA